MKESLFYRWEREYWRTVAIASEVELLGWLGVLQGVQGVRYAALNVGLHHTVVQAGGWAALGKWDDGCGLKAGGNDAKCDKLLFF